ncbi:hypothetical protein [Aquimarina algicola]|uniref:Uncharacterized protein n=1 Tax=Aquimarina algicola TaxID=2589995 RepID=A0A504JEI2_9FLAO|nr:hypothetical protein [Aquimarina algicola]TPN86118.1 hypothetical protein FHK87_12660 [Aquimarina algicola]
MKKKKKIDPNLLIAIGVLIASFSALFVYIKQANIMSKQTDILLEQTKANAWPRLDVGIDRGYDNDTLYSLNIQMNNKGIGPAIIEAVRVTYKNEPAKDWWDLFVKTKLPDSIDNGIANVDVYNSVVSANENFYWLELKENPYLASWVFDKRKDIKIEVCYKSVFDDYWLLTNKELVSTTIEKLETNENPIPKSERFRN